MDIDTERINKMNANKKAPASGVISRGKAGDFGMTTESLMPIVTHATRRRKVLLPTRRELLTMAAVAAFFLVLLWAVGQIMILWGVA